MLPSATSLDSYSRCRHVLSNCQLPPLTTADQLMPLRPLHYVSVIRVDTKIMWPLIITDEFEVYFFSSLPNTVPPTTNAPGRIVPRGIARAV